MKCWQLLLLFLEYFYGKVCTLRIGLHLRISLMWSQPMCSLQLTMEGKGRPERGCTLCVWAWVCVCVSVYASMYSNLPSNLGSLSSCYGSARKGNKSQVYQVQEFRNQIKSFLKFLPVICSLRLNFVSTRKQLTCHAWWPPCDLCGQSLGESGWLLAGWFHCHSRQWHTNNSDNLHDSPNLPNHIASSSSPQNLLGACSL